MTISWVKDFPAIYAIDWQKAICIFQVKVMEFKTALIPKRAEPHKSASDGFSFSWFFFSATRPGFWCRPPQLKPCWIAFLWAIWICLTVSQFCWHTCFYKQMFMEEEVSYSWNNMWAISVTVFPGSWREKLHYKLVCSRQERKYRGQSSSKEGQQLLGVSKLMETWSKGEISWEEEWGMGCNFLGQPRSHSIQTAMLGLLYLANTERLKLYELCQEA